ADRPAADDRDRHRAGNLPGRLRRGQAPGGADRESGCQASGAGAPEVGDLQQRSGCPQARGNRKADRRTGGQAPGRDRQEARRRAAPTAGTAAPAGGGGTDGSAGAADGGAAAGGGGSRAPASGGGGSRTPAPGGGRGGAATPAGGAAAGRSRTRGIERIARDFPAGPALSAGGAARGRDRHGPSG